MASKVEQGPSYTFTLHALKARPPVVVLQGSGETMTREEATRAANHFASSDRWVETSMILVRHAEEGWLELFPDGKGRWQGFLPKAGQELGDVLSREDAKTGEILKLFATRSNGTR